MRFLAILAASIYTVGAVAETPIDSGLEVLESLYRVPYGWTQLDKPDPETRLRLQVAFDLPDHALFEETLFAISTPDHPEYGNHLSRQELRDLTKPAAAATEVVLSWLKASGIVEDDIENDEEWVSFKVSVKDAEKMMDTTFHYFQVEDGSQPKKIRTMSYSVPHNVSSHVAMIHPTVRFGQMKAQRSAPFSVEYYGQADAAVAAVSTTTPAGLDVTACNITITPDCLRALYNVGNYTADPHVGSLFGVAGYLKEYAKYDALDVFLEKYAPQTLSQNFTYQLIKGGLATQNDTVDDDVEANLDIQYAASLGYKQKITYYSTGGLGELIPDLDQPDLDDNQNEPYIEFLKHLLSLPDKKLPQTITTSYGEDEQSVPEGYSRTACNMFGKLGLRGVSILFSSGDTGPGSACQTNDGKNTTRFLPIFPAACPYVTSVGGTYKILPEKAVPFSSGGFSDRFPRPSYQDSAIKEYLNILGPRWAGLYNPEGRGFPDVAAQGYRFHVMEQNATSGGFSNVLVGGTSASSPAFAALVSLLNNARLKHGRKPLGFLNPWLYSSGKDGLVDIVNGGSAGCTGTDIYSGLPAPYVPYAGWNATIGWDPVTGLGTPDFGKLLEISSAES